MSSQTDKVIFVSSLALAVASGAFFLVGADAPAVKDIAVTKAAPTPVTIEDPINPLSVWAYPTAQRLLPQDPKVNKVPIPFILQLFTPMKLYYKPTYWTVTSNIPPPPPFPFELKAIYQKPFRIQFGSYSKVGDEITVYLKDLELRKEIEVKEGDRLTAQGIEVKKVVLEDASEGGGINKIASVEIYDTRSKRTYKLVEKQAELMEPPYYARVTDGSKKDFEVIVGSKLSSGSLTYTVKSLDPASKNLSFEFKLPDDREPTIEVLAIKTTTKP